MFDLRAKQLSHSFKMALIIAAATMILSLSSKRVNASSASPIFAATALEISPNRGDAFAPAHYSYLASSLYPIPVYQGKVTSFDIKVIRDNQAEMDFGALLGDPELGQYHVRMTSGTSKGRCFLIEINNVEGTLYLSEDPSNWIEIGDSFVIERNPSLTAFFGKENSFSDLQSGKASDEADLVSIMGNLGKLTSFYHHRSGSIPQSWQNAQLGEAETTQIKPNQGLIIHRKSSSEGFIFTCGLVSDKAKTYILNPGINLFGSGTLSESVSLDNLSLGHLTSGLNLFEADSITIPSNNGSQKTYFQLQLDSSSIWVTENYHVANSVLIQPGQAFYINRLLSKPPISWTPSISD